ncbi:MAG: hypothetical protein M1816_007631 [Peltula sp. TS41687]|nr:MAG: hypothetical protein M1816_007631 [Peltula sp. TS41687]
MPLRYQATQKGGPFALVGYAQPTTPGPNEVIIRTKAVGLNPVDWKQLDSGFFIPSFPTILGCDAAGIISAVGSDVRSFQPGDAVFAHCTPGDDKTGAFQDFVVLPAHMVGPKPASWSFEDASSLPVVVVTAAANVFDGLGVALPQLGLNKDAPTAAASNGKEQQQQQHPSTVLVLGGSSAVGAATIQLLRLALGPGAAILATSSARHHEHLRSLGASEVWDYHVPVPELVERIKGGEAAGPVTAIVDCVGGLAAQPELLDVLQQDNKQKSTGARRIVVEVMTGHNLGAEQMPEGVVHRQIIGSSVLKTQPAFFARLAEYLAKGDGDGFRLPVPVEVLGYSWDCVADGLARLREGKVSGAKLVVGVE